MGPRSGTGRSDEEYRRRLARLAQLEESLPSQVTSAVDEEIVRIHGRKAEELRKDPKFASEIAERERRALEFLRAEIEAERELIELFL